MCPTPRKHLPPLSRIFHLTVFTDSSQDSLSLSVTVGVTSPQHSTPTTFSIRKKSQTYYSIPVTLSLYTPAPLLRILSLYQHRSLYTSAPAPHTCPSPPHQQVLPEPVTAHLCTCTTHLSLSHHGPPVPFTVCLCT